MFIQGGTLPIINRVISRRSRVKFEPQGNPFIRPFLKGFLPQFITIGSGRPCRECIILAPSQWWWLNARSRCLVALLSESINPKGKSREVSCDCLVLSWGYFNTGVQRYQLKWSFCPNLHNFITTPRCILQLQTLFMGNFQLLSLKPTFSN